MAKQITLKRAWITAVLIYSVIRTLVIWKIFAKYGVNQYFYLFIDVVSAYFFAIYSAKLIIEASRTHYRALFKFLALTLLFNFIPDIYVLANANEVPTFILQSFIKVILILAAVSAFSIYREIKKRRIGSES